MPEEPTIQNPGPIKVLCIEDEYFIGDLYSRVLKKSDYEVTSEPDGMRGLELAQTDNYDIILLDLMLPTMSGADILTALRDPKQTPNLHSKIIVITNLEQRPEMRAEIEKNADGYIVKANITPKGLVEFLSNIRLDK